jgi:DedD protein
MDRRVKERLIGASILVALIVLVVPELLSGPKTAQPAQPSLPAAAPEPNRTVTVDLSTSKSPANTDSEPPADAASAASAASTAPTAPAASPIVVPLSDATPSAAQPAKLPATRAPAVESAAPRPISSTHGTWSVQLGSFASRANADNLTRQMKGQGLPAFVLEGGSASSVRYRVRIGPLPDRESAERMAAKLKTLGHVSSLVAPAG